MYVYYDVGFYYMCFRVTYSFDSSDVTIKWYKAWVHVQLTLLDWQEYTTVYGDEHNVCSFEVLEKWAPAPETHPQGPRGDFLLL